MNVKDGSFGEFVFTLNGKEPPTFKINNMEFESERGERINVEDCIWAVVEKLISSREHFN